jgi:hypothetical protein
MKKTEKNIKKTKNNTLKNIYKKQKEHLNNKCKSKKKIEVIIWKKL